MGRHIQGNDGKFAGSVGDGKTTVPTPSDLPPTAAPTVSATDTQPDYTGLREQMHTRLTTENTPTAALTEAVHALLVDRARHDTIISRPDPETIRLGFPTFGVTVDTHPNPTDGTVHCAAYRITDRLLDDNAYALAAEVVLADNPTPIWNVTLRSPFGETPTPEKMPANVASIIMSSVPPALIRIHKEAGTIPPGYANQAEWEFVRDFTPNI